MNSKNEHLTILSDAERSALYERPEYNNEQRLEYLNLTPEELQIALGRHNLSAQIYCILQFGYFKAVKMFFRITWEEADQKDVTFILQQYFQNQIFDPQVISKHEHYAQCDTISSFFGYRYWAKTIEQDLLAQAEKIIRRDMNPQFIAMELLDYLQSQKIIRPGYTTLQTIVSAIINAERNRLVEIINGHLSDDEKKLLDSLMVEEETLSKLAALKQDAKDFKPQMMVTERNKLETLRPIYQIIKRLLPMLKLSQQKLHYYADLINYYSIHELRERLNREHSYIYIMCYCWKRFQQVSDNLTNAFSFFFNKIESEIKVLTNTTHTAHVMSQREEFIVMKRLAQLYVDDKLPDEMNFGLVRKKAFEILSKEDLLHKVSVIAKKPAQEEDFYWQATDKFKRKVTSNLRNLVAALDFSSTNPENRWMEALQWIKTDFPRSKQSAPFIDDCPDKTIPAKLLPYFSNKTDDNSEKINQSRYEFWIYKQINSQLKKGSIFLEDSLQYRSLSHELVSLEEKDSLIKQLGIPALSQPISAQLDTLFIELNELWEVFNRELKKDNLKHLRYDEKEKTLHWQKPNVKKNEKLQSKFYKQMKLLDITDVLRCVNKRCDFMSAFTHIQPRYSKQPAKEDCLIGTLIAQAMNNGNLNMADISDIPYAALQETLQSRVRLATLKNASNLISNDISKMPIFPFYSFDLEMLYGGVDGQKLETETPTLKTRFSKK
jgi:hypothetical protein